ncbi:acetate/propionate family kinase [soil metagenome]
MKENMQDPATGAVIVVLNCGSSSIKFAVFDADIAPLPRKPAWSGKVEGITGSAPTFSADDRAAEPLTLDAARPSQPLRPSEPSQLYHAALAHIRLRVLGWLGGRPIAAVAHRVVHGGSQHFAPVRIDRAVLDELAGLIPLAPLHQPFALEAIETLLAERADLPQVACFDTAFHHTLPQVEQMLPLSWDAWLRGLRRYGFHGLSYEYMSIALPERHGDAAKGRTIVAHLGSGASLCAMDGLRSVATTMGFSALDGLMMGTRCGALDPGAILHLMDTEGLTPQQVGHLLYHESGLLGISGVSSDPRELLRCEQGNPRAEAALALYVRRIVREIGSLVAVLGGIHMLAFTAGIGEHNAAIRERICAGLGFLGLVIDPAANLANAPVVSGRESRVRVVVEPTNEEWVAAQHAVDLVAAAGPALRPSSRPS